MTEQRTLYTTGNTDSELVAAWQARPQDDQTREDAIAALRGGYRISPTNKLVIERRLSSNLFGFYRVCDSPADAKRSLAVLCEDAEQEAALLANAGDLGGVEV